jgi:putative glutamine amidotransferase
MTARRIAIPMPHSADREYAERAIPLYERAVASAGGEPVRIPLDQSSAAVKKLIESCGGVLLPGSNADVDPGKFRQARSTHTADADTRREEVDFLLLDDAFKHRKPVLGICYGLQSLNVYRSGSLIQHIPDFLPESTRAKVNHEAGKKVAVAHRVDIVQGSRLAGVVSRNGCGESGDLKGHGFNRASTGSQKIGALAPADNGIILPVNSSHHQSADAVGDGLRIVARCAEDGIIEALEGTSPDHFVLAVQWHPERSVDDDAASPAVFQALVEAAKI